jgi:pimeloyl-ACP methyl ester carboxylesterase
VLFQAHADTVFGEDAEQVQRVLDLYLHDRQQQARALTETLNYPLRDDVRVLVGPDPHPLSGKLRSLLRVHQRELAAISPEHQLAGLRVPILLIHGVDDPIIPSSETAWLALEVPQGALRASLITGAIRHAELEEQPSLQDLWALVRWTAALLEVQEHQARSALLH